MSKPLGISLSFDALVPHHLFDPVDDAAWFHEMSPDRMRATCVVSIDHAAVVSCGLENLTFNLWRRESPKLLQHAQVVYQHPLLCDLAIRKAEDLDGR